MNYLKMVLPALSLMLFACGAPKKEISEHQDNIMTVQRTLKDRAMEACAGSEKIALGVMEAFLRETPKTIALIVAAAQAKDQRQLNLAGHKLKGSMRLLKYENEALICFDLEKFNPENSSWEAITSQVQRLSELFDAIAAESK